MRAKFKEFYEPTENELKDAWTNGYFSFDANVLLNLYRYTESTTKDFIKIISFLSKKKKIVIPYQAAFEYQKNRISVIDYQNTAYAKIKEDLKKQKNAIEGILNKYKRHPYINSDDLNKIFETAFEAVDGKLIKLSETHPDLLKIDHIFDQLTDLLNDSILDKFSDEQKNQIFKEGKIRYEKKIPPGFADSEKIKSGDENIYGDLIIWKELLARFKDNNDKLIFVTDDLKEDWWTIYKGKTLYPRTELVREFKDVTGKDIYIYKPENYLRHAAKYLNQKINNETLDEIVNIRNLDELKRNLDFSFKRKMAKSIDVKRFIDIMHTYQNQTKTPLQKLLESMKDNDSPELKKFVSNIQFNNDFSRLNKYLEEYRKSEIGLSEFETKLATNEIDDNLDDIDDEVAKKSEFDDGFNQTLNEIS